MPARNIELKARCSDLTRAERAAMDLGARLDAVLLQTDTYFRVLRGRLKLREINGDRAELIWYERPNDPHPRPSDYSIVTLPSAEPLRTALSAALGVVTRVHKRRRVFLWHNVRIHLDEVTGLGHFLEFEAVISESHPEPISRQRLQELAGAFAIQPSDHLADSYSDMTMRHAACHL